MRLDATSRAALAKQRAKPALRLLRAEDVYATRALLASTAPPPICEWAFTLYPPVFVDRDQPDLSRRGQSSDVETVAFVNDGRWLARCPFCHSAQVVSPLDPRLLCAGLDGCANGPVRGAYVQVKFPTAKTTTGIEQALLARSSRSDRCWEPHETVADLLTENDRLEARR